MSYWGDMLYSTTCFMLKDHTRLNASDTKTDEQYHYEGIFRIEKELVSEIHTSGEMPQVKILIENELLNNSLVTES